MRNLKSPKSFEEKILEVGKSLMKKIVLIVNGIKTQNYVLLRKPKKKKIVFYKFIDSIRLYSRQVNLALTPEGATKFGEDDRNIVIDEEGFSRYDLADLAAIAPDEVVP